jgi:hypothetical protein
MKRSGNHKEKRRETQKRECQRGCWGRNKIIKRALQFAECSVRQRESVTAGMRHTFGLEHEKEEAEEKVSNKQEKAKEKAANKQDALEGAHKKLKELLRARRTGWEGEGPPSRPRERERDARRPQGKSVLVGFCVHSHRRGGGFL